MQPIERQPVPFSDIFRDLPDDSRQLYIFYLRSRSGRTQVRVYDTPTPTVGAGISVTAWAPIPRVSVTGGRSDLFIRSVLGKIPDK